MSDSVRPHRWQPIRLCRPWDSPGKNAGVGCHFLLQCVKVKSESEVTQSCLTLSDPMDCSLVASSIHGIFQARVLEWGAIVFSRLLIYYKGYQRIQIKRRWRDTQGRIPSKGASVLVGSGTQHRVTWKHSGSPRYSLSKPSPSGFYGSFIM